MLAAILDEYGVETIPIKATRRPRQTCAGKTLENILGNHGEDHLRAVLSCLMEGENNAMALVAPVITAVSDLLLAHRDWWEADASRWLAVMDTADLNRMFDEAKRNRHAVMPKSCTVAALLFHELAAAFAPRERELFDKHEGESA